MTTTDLVPVVVDLSTQAVDRQLEALRAARAWVGDADLAEATTAYQRAQLIREWVRIERAAEDIGAEAARLEATALRRLGQLRGADGFGGDKRKAAAGFAAMSDEEFLSALDSIGKGASAVTIWKHIEAERAAAEDQQVGAMIGSGRVSYPATVGTEELEAASRAVLSTAFDSGRTTSVTEAAKAVAAALDLEREFASNSAVREGCRRAIRSALYFEAMGTESGDMPPFITYRDKEAGWVRIPSQVASVEQVVAWAHFRMRQADEYVAAAKEADAISSELLAKRDRHPQIVRAAELLAAS